MERGIPMQYVAMTRAQEQLSLLVDNSALRKAKSKILPFGDISVSEWYDVELGVPRFNRHIDKIVQCVETFIHSSITDALVPSEDGTDIRPLHGPFDLLRKLLGFTTLRPQISTTGAGCGDSDHELGSICRIIHDLSMTSECDDLLIAAYISHKYLTIDNISTMKIDWEYSANQPHLLKRLLYFIFYPVESGDDHVARDRGRNRNFQVVLNRIRENPLLERERAILLRNASTSGRDRDFFWLTIKMIQVIGSHCFNYLCIDRILPSVIRHLDEYRKRRQATHRRLVGTILENTRLHKDLANLVVDYLWDTHLK